MSGELREIASAVRFLSASYACERPFDTTREVMVQAASHSQFPEEIRTKYIRDTGCSVVQTVVHVKSGMGGFFTFEARVFVRVMYEVDAARISPAGRETISRRLDELAQRHCVDFVAANFYEKHDIPLIAGWHGVPAESD
jgi:hypothetical protein